MRGLTVLALLTHEATGYQPITDGTILPQAPKNAIAAGNFNRVATIDGSNHDEFRLFTALDFDLVPGVGPITAATYPFALAAEVGPALAPLVAAEYPLASYASPDLANSAALTDATFACTARLLTRDLARFVPTYGYEFADERAPELFLPPVAYPYAAAHASEIQYLFNLRAPIPQPLAPVQQELAERMVGYWTSFAKTGVPRAGEATRWYRYDPAYDNVLSLATPQDRTFTGFLGEHRCTFWDPFVAPSAASAGAAASRESLEKPMVRGMLAH